MKLLSIVVFLFISLLSFAKDSTYFNKLVYPQQGTNTIKAVIKIDSFYYVSATYLDTPFYYTNTQGFQIMKIDLQGNILNSKVWIDSTRNITYGVFRRNGLIKATDENIYACGGIMDSLNIASGLLVCLSQTLDTLWTRTYTHPDTAAAAQAGASIFNAFTAIRQTYDGGFIITGMYNPGCVQNADRKAYLLKTDSVGGVEWIKKYNTDGFYDIELASDSGYYFPAFLNHQAKVFKADKYGNIQWQLIVNSNNIKGYPMDLELLNSNTLYVSSRYAYDVTYIKTGITLTKINTQSHTKQWEKNYIVFNNFTCQSLHQSMGLDILSSGDLIISGTVEMLNPNNAQELYHKGMIMKVNSNGDSLWARWHGHGLFTDACQFNDIVLTDDGGFLAVGWQWHPTSGIFYQNAWLVKMDSMGCDTAGCDIYDAISQPQIHPKINMKLYPNPTSDYFRISADGVEQLHNLWLRITDMNGRTIRTIKLENTSSDMLVDIQDLKAGVYSISLYAADILLEVEKLTVIK